MAEPESFYLSAERRVEWLTLGLGLAAALAAHVRYGWQFGAGVALGAALTWINFRWLKQGVAGLIRVSTAQTGAERPRVPRGVYVKFFGRFALLLLAVYVILSRSWLPMPAVIGGLFAAVAAVMLEMVWELVHGRHGTERHS